MDVEENIDRLKQEARKRWGERWTVEARFFADGDVNAHAFQSRGQTPEGHLEQDILFITDDGDVVGERVVLEQGEISSEELDLTIDR